MSFATPAEHDEVACALAVLLLADAGVKVDTAMIEKVRAFCGMFLYYRSLRLPTTPLNPTGLCFSLSSLVRRTSLRFSLSLALVLLLPSVRYVFVA